MKTLDRGAITRPSGYVRLSVPQELRRDQVDVENGIIRGYAVISRGEALGHGFWIDGYMLKQVEAAGNAVSGGIKSRFTHPGLSGDGLGKYLGRSINFQVDGDRVLADLTLSKAAKVSPEGDLAAYVLALAEEDPKAFGASIVFSRDVLGESVFYEANASEGKGFVSPDKRNKKNLRHARLLNLAASDVVDSPAANPDGFLSVEGSEEMLRQVEGAMPYILGLSEEVPQCGENAVSPERIRDYVQGYLARNELTVKKEGRSHMDEEKVTPVALTVESLKKDHPEIVKALTAEATEAALAAGYEKGVAAERERANAISQFAIACNCPREASVQILSGKPLSEAMGEIGKKKADGLESPENPGTGGSAGKQSGLADIGPMDDKGMDEIGKKAEALRAANPSLSYRDALIQAAM